MKTVMNTAAVILNTIVMVAALPMATMATALEAEQVGSFSDATSVKFVKHHHQLFALVNDDENFDVYRSNKKGENWEKMDDSAPANKDLVSDTTTVTTFGVFRNKVYVAAVNTDGMVQVWNICIHCRPAAWEQSGEAGFGDSANTTIVDFFTVGDDFYAITENSAGNGLFVTADGDSWTQVGSYGLGLSLTDVVRGSRVRVMDNAVHIGTTGGSVYQADKTDLSTWSLLTTFTGEITALHGRFVAVVKDGETALYESDQDGTYTQVGETVTGEATRFTHTGLKRVSMLLSDASAGTSYVTLNLDDATWETLLDGGFGNVNNTSVDSFVQYRGKRYAATVNATDGPEVYKITR